MGEIYQSLVVVISGLLTIVTTALTIVGCIFWSCGCLSAFCLSLRLDDPKGKKVNLFRYRGANQNVLFGIFFE